MNPATETLLRRAVSQAVTLTRQNTRCVFTDKRHGSPSPADGSAASLSSMALGDHVKTIMDLPGPEGYPIVGSALEYFRKPNRGQMHEVQRRYHAKYGRIFKERMGPITNLSIADPQLVEEIFRQEGKYPIRPPYEAWLLYKEMNKRSKGIVSASGEEWRKIRSQLNHSLMKPRQLQRYMSDLSQVAQDLANKLGTVRDQNTNDNTVPNILNVLYSWSIESIGQVLIDERFGCLKEDMSPRMYNFVNAIENMMYTSHQLMVFSNVHKKFNTKIWRTFVQSWDVIVDVANNILDSKKAVLEDRLARGGEMTDVTVFEHFLTNDQLTMEEIYTNMTELLLSGVDTTSNTLAVSMFLLSRHPRVLERLQDELDTLDTENSGFTQEHLKHMPYTKAIAKEVLRLFPTVPTNARVLAEDTFIDGYLIPKNTIVMLNTFTMCRNPQEFNNPDEFIPERWLRNEIREFSPFTSLPFGFGARSCVGRRVAETMVHLGIAHIAKRYNLRPIESSKEIKPFVRTVLTLGNDLPVELYDR